MSSTRATFLLKYFGDRFILLKDDWLHSVVEFIHTKVPAAKNFDDAKFANLVFEQWKCSNFESTSFPIFANHGIEPSTSKLELKSPLVCQIMGLIDVGSSYYSQYCRLGDKSREDNSGFEKVFQEKDDDSDKKTSRMLKLTLTDGEYCLNAIELFKIPHLSLYIKPGCKIVISPPALFRKGSFLLKPESCQILGGECLPLLNSHRPFDQYAKLLKLKVEEKKEECSKKISESSASSSSGIGSSIRSYSTQATTSGFSDIDAFEDYMENHYESPPCSLPATPPPKSPSPVIRVSSILNRLNSEFMNDEMPSTSRRVTISPVRKKSKPSTSINQTPQFSGMLTSRRSDPRDEKLENMIEENEEPISFANERERSVISSVKKQSDRRISVNKIIKTEQVDEDDDDIQIIEIATPSPTVKKAPVPAREDSISPIIADEAESEKAEKLTRDETMALESFSKLVLSKIGDCVRKMKYCIGSKQFVILGTVEEIMEPLRVVDNLWTMKIRIADDSKSIDCYVDNQTLENMIGFTCQQAINIRESSDMEKRKDGKRKLQALEHQLQRLDLVFEIDFFNDSLSVPVIRSIKTMAALLDAY